MPEPTLTISYYAHGCGHVRRSPTAGMQIHAHTVVVNTPPGCSEASFFMEAWKKLFIDFQQDTQLRMDFVQMQLAASTPSQEYLKPGLL